MCRKVKDIKTEEINRLKEKYENVLNGKIECNMHKISNFVNLVIPILAQQYKDQSKIRYNCLFSNCIPHKRSYQTKQKYVQHVYLKHSNLLPGQGLFLINQDQNISCNGFWCSKCGKNFKRKDHLQNHINKVKTCSSGSILTKNPNLDKIQNISKKDKKYETEIITLDETFSQCSLVDISLTIPVNQENQDDSIIIIDQ